MLEDEIPTKEYEVVIRALLPGNVKASDHIIKVKTKNGIEGAHEEAKSIWYKGTEITDVRIKEINNVIKGNGAE